MTYNRRLFLGSLVTAALGAPLGSDYDPVGENYYEVVNDDGEMTAEPLTFETSSRKFSKAIRKFPVDPDQLIYWTKFALLGTTYEMKWDVMDSKLKADAAYMEAMPKMISESCDDKECNQGVDFDKGKLCSFRNLLKESIMPALKSTSSDLNESSKVKRIQKMLEEGISSIQSLKASAKKHIVPTSITSLAAATNKLIKLRRPSYMKDALNCFKKKKSIDGPKSVPLRAFALAKKIGDLAQNRRDMAPVLSPHLQHLFAYAQIFGSARSDLDFQGSTQPVWNLESELVALRGPAFVFRYVRGLVKLMDNFTLSSLRELEFYAQFKAFDAIRKAIKIFKDILPTLKRDMVQKEIADKCPKVNNLDCLFDLDNPQVEREIGNLAEYYEERMLNEIALQKLFVSIIKSDQELIRKVLITRPYFIQDGEFGNDKRHSSV